MGITYFGPYAEEIDTYRHEGYTARVMPDGTETATFGGEYGRTGHVGYRARCECGWSGLTVFPVADPDPMECPEAEQQWHDEHITALVEQAQATLWPNWQQHVTTRAAAVVRHVEAGRHRQACDLLMNLREDLDARLRTLEDVDQQAHGGGEW